MASERDEGRYTFTGSFGANLEVVKGCEDFFFPLLLLLLLLFLTHEVR